MKNLFEKGNKITTNNLNIFEILDSNESDVVCKDLITNDFYIFDKQEHKFEKANAKNILIETLKIVLNESDISDENKKYIYDSIHLRIDKWL